MAKERKDDEELVKSKDPKMWGLEVAAKGALTPAQFAQLQKDTAAREQKIRIKINQMEATMPLETDAKKKAALKKALATLKVTLTVPAKPANTGGRKLV